MVAMQIIKVFFPVVLNLEKHPRNLHLYIQPSGQPKMGWLLAYH